MKELSSTRDAYGHALIELGSTCSDLMVLDSDLSRSTRTDWFQAKFPEKFLNVGIAEQNMIGISAGLAATGLVPFATTYTIFIGRCYDQIRQSIGYNRSNVKIVATHSGFSTSFDGGSHQSFEDLALMRSIPGMVVLAPADYHETKRAVHFAAGHVGPVYIRIGKYDQPACTTESDKFELGEPQVMKLGEHIAIVATGALVAEAIQAAQILSETGHNVTVVKMTTLKPVNVPSLLRALAGTYIVYTLEEHSIIGGLYSTVVECLARPAPRQVIPIGVKDQFGESGEWRQLLEHYGFTAAPVAARILADLRAFA
jgi:transketolase